METTPTLSGRDIVCFANDWTGDPLSKQHIMRRLARTNRVLWVNSLGNRRPGLNGRDLRRLASKARRFFDGVREVEPNLFVLSPLAVPAYGSAAVGAVNRAWLGVQIRRAMARLHFDRVINYTFVPASAWIAGHIGEELLVYHVADEYSAFAGATSGIAELDADLCRRADLVIACSHPLLESKRALARRAVLVRHGVDYEHFRKATLDSTPIAPEVRNLPRPVIGFHGLVAEWVDLGYVRAVADAFPGGTVVLVGDITRDRTPLGGARNVTCLGRRPYGDLPSLCKGFDVALLPFTLGTLTRAANPLKLREYLAAGLPVAATAIPEAVALADHGLFIAPPEERAAGFVGAVRAALASPTPRAERSRGMAGETWDAKVETIGRAILSASREAADAAAG